MDIYMAPMEGVTNYVFRKAYIKHFKGVDKFFTPFITPHMKKGFSKSELMELNANYNKTQYLIPQILTNNSDDFLKLAYEIKEMGYNEFNINLGCPSGTVTSKKRGSGFLQDVVALDRFFYDIFEKKDDIKISVKTRIGFSDYDEWEDLLKVYEKYEFCEIIIHPRLRSDFYKNNIHMEALLSACKELKQKLIYNGDINTLEDNVILNKNLPSNRVFGIMIGRGLVRNPFLAESIKKKDNIYDIDKAVEFLNDIVNEYLSLDFGERNTLFKLKEIWGMMLGDNEKYTKILKKIRKSNTVKEYNLVVNEFKNME
ncbi:tRNA-dihydrouridine synthase family protein [Lachnoanaerobaculum umeaense]|uniref:tRNA-dihydrouridine synthase n=1 Tax=Lachnoanaerobaculum umeaense TaxID=617123 RepID=A0A385PZV0_9FIRM|nr:tRNA-dihydrouridine synthase family protein [Lachnoanaerobaculum umeaense]AYA99721.1 tRNA-dihydrouridine synthase family protein [Lachnoanaerobaculum umeaense]PZW97721.1 tRNA-U20a,U20b-dihydrouridine synthase [Lachnoanaerobaculum umeaense]